MVEALALLDLKLCVLDAMGHADHASRRLGAVLRLLSSPAELFTPMLKGLDAAELMVSEAERLGCAVHLSQQVLRVELDAGESGEPSA